MTKHEYSVEEIRLMAGVYQSGKVFDMLTAYATLLEQIERAKAGMTDEVAALVAQAFQDSQVQLSVPRLGIHVMNWADCSPEWQAEHTRRMHTALQAVAHLLPSGESGGVRVRCQHCGTIFTKRDWIAYNFHRPIPRCPFCGASGEPKPARADALETFIHPPAQAAQVDADELIGAYDEATRRQRGSGFLPEAAQRAARDCVEHNRDRLRKAILAAPTAEPVARGEANDLTDLANEVEACWICASIGEGEITLQTINNWSGRLSALAGSAPIDQSKTCPNCDSFLPEGCGGIFKSERECALFTAAPSHGEPS